MALADLESIKALAMARAIVEASVLNFIMNLLNAENKSANGSIPLHCGAFMLFGVRVNKYVVCGGIRYLTVQRKPRQFMLIVAQMQEGSG
jgi:hypothetical protein